MIQKRKTSALLQNATALLNLFSSDSFLGFDTHRKRENLKKLHVTNSHAHVVTSESVIGQSLRTLNTWRESRHAREKHSFPTKHCLFFDRSLSVFPSPDDAQLRVNFETIRGSLCSIYGCKHVQVLGKNMSRVERRIEYVKRKRRNSKR